MKKSELISIINANRVINKNKKILSIIEKRDCFPKIDDLKEEFGVLSKEVQSSYDESTKYKQIPYRY